ncbi:hypothetical protein [Methanosarcina sp. MSH10X1]|uniref:hypothetical protein n=1 Tax=Methanosarcina sp. MSH10X1 TaxID=2507075 RepID=UPI0013E3FDC2|nr:hypothetical protein [Methanosarcina sp. MSH10X1]
METENNLEIKNSKPLFTGKTLTGRENFKLNGMILYTKYSAEKEIAGSLNKKDTK